MPTWVSTHMSEFMERDQHSSQWLKPGYPTLASLFLLHGISSVPFLKGQFTRMPPGILYRGQHLSALGKTAHQDSPGDLYNRRDHVSHACHGTVQPTPRSSHLPLHFLCYSMSPSYLPNINLKVLYDSKLNNSCNPHNSRKFCNYPFTEVRKMIIINNLLQNCKPEQSI